MAGRVRFTRGRSIAIALLFVTVVSGAAIGVIASGSHKSEHWGVITRNTIGSPVAELRSGPYVSGPAGEPPFGKGSLGIYVADKSTSLTPPSEHASFGNEVDFFGDHVLDLAQVGFHVFQTGENADINPRNMPNITFEIDANLTSLPADNYTSMVWVPDPAPVVNQWSGYIDATSTGDWYFTGAEGGATGCTSALMCNFAAAMAALGDGGAEPIIYSVAIGKGRDYQWAGAVDGLRMNNRVYDFEAEPKGVHERSAK